MNRAVWPDIAKGIAILLVVINHAGEGIFNANIVERNQVWRVFHDFCYTFMVPVFFVLSGYFSQLSSKLLKSRVKSLFSSLVYPYVLWSVLQTSLMVITKAGNKVPVWSDFPSILLDGWMQFWFLHSLILIVSLDILFRSLKIIPRIRICIAALISAMVILKFEFPWKFQLMASHVIYFETGIIAALAAQPFKRMVNLKSVVIVSGIAVVSLFIAGAGHGSSIRMVGAFAGITFCISSSMVLGKSYFWQKTLGYLGQFSLQIYVLHIIFSAGGRVLLAKFGVESFWIHLVAGAILGVVAPLIASIIDAKFGRLLFRADNWNSIVSRLNQSIKNRQIHLK